MIVPQLPSFEGGIAKPAAYSSLSSYSLKEPSATLTIPARLVSKRQSSLSILQHSCEFESVSEIWEGMNLREKIVSIFCASDLESLFEDLNQISPDESLTSSIELPEGEISLRFWREGNKFNLGVSHSHNTKSSFEDLINLFLSLPHQDQTLLYSRIKKLNSILHNPISDAVPLLFDKIINQQTKQEETMQILETEMPEIGIEQLSAGVTEGQSLDNAQQVESPESAPFSLSQQDMHFFTIVEGFEFLGSGNEYNNHQFFHSSPLEKPDSCTEEEFEAACKKIEEIHNALSPSLPNAPDELWSLFRVEPKRVTVKIQIEAGEKRRILLPQPFAAQIEPETIRIEGLQGWDFRPTKYQHLTFIEIPEMTEKRDLFYSFKILEVPREASGFNYWGAFWGDPPELMSLTRPDSKLDEWPEPTRKFIEAMNSRILRGSLQLGECLEEVIEHVGSWYEYDFDLAYNRDYADNFVERYGEFLGEREHSQVILLEFIHKHCSKICKKTRRLKYKVKCDGFAIVTREIFAHLGFSVIFSGGVSVSEPKVTSATTHATTLNFLLTDDRRSIYPFSIETAFGAEEHSPTDIRGLFNRNRKKNEDIKFLSSLYYGLEEYLSELAILYKSGHSKVKEAVKHLIRIIIQNNPAAAFLCPDEDIILIFIDYLKGLSGRDFLKRLDDTKVYYRAAWKIVSSNQEIIKKLNSLKNKLDIDTISSLSELIDPSDEEIIKIIQAEIDWD
ncbi:MAG: hypothetical protein ABIE74_03350 [Pseudomonadota bacterium]